jgi:flagellar basal-body rod protein FlgB
LDPVYLFALASRHVNWASTRQTVITGNIANANTSGYEAMEIEPFSDVLSQTGLTMARTASAHLGIDAGGARAGNADAATGWAVSPSGAPVSLDKELMKADQVSRAVSLDATIERAFQRMLLTSVRSS